MPWTVTLTRRTDTSQCKAAIAIFRTVRHAPEDEEAQHVHVYGSWAPNEEIWGGIEIITDTLKWDNHLKLLNYVTRIDLQEVKMSQRTMMKS